MKCSYCEHGMMFMVGDECIEVYQCVGCNAILLKDIELNRNEYVWYREEPLSSHAVLGEGWRAVRKELPVTPFLAYWSDDRITILEEGDSVSYALTGDPDKRIIAWIPLSEIVKPAFA